MQKKKGNGKKHNAISPNLQKLCNFNNAKNKLPPMLKRQTTQQDND